VKIEVLFFGRPRELAGSARKIVSVKEGAKLIDLFRLLDSRYDAKFTSDLKDKEALIVMVNGRHYSSLDGLETQLSDKDTVAIMPAVIGG
jgi:MoaD family protein